MITTLLEADIPIEGVRSHLLQGEKQQFVFMRFEKDVGVPEHLHEAHWGVVLDGEIEVTSDGKECTCIKGDTYLILNAVKHRVKVYILANIKLPEFYLIIGNQASRSPQYLQKTFSGSDNLYHIFFSVFD
ncbi:MAG: cupin domain-containing protein [Candidatus Heimdallarchaeota archaeon]